MNKPPLLKFTVKELEVINALVGGVDLGCEDTQLYLSCRRIVNKVTKELEYAK